MEVDNYYDEESNADEDNHDAMDSSDDEEYNLTHFGISQALPVPDGLPDPDAGPPQTAEEYLRWVRYEASLCPRITRKDVDPAKLKQSQPQHHQQQGQQEGESGQASTSGAQSGGNTSGTGTGGGGGGGARGRRYGTSFAAQTPPPVTSSCQEWARPSSSWLRAFMQDFARLRQALSAMQRHHANTLSATPLPPLDNTAAWDRLCFEQWEPLEQTQEQQQPANHSAPEAIAPGAPPLVARAGEAPVPPPPPPPPPPLPPSQPQQTTKPHRGRGGGGGGDRDVDPSSSETDRLSGPVVRTVLALDQVAVSALLGRHVALLTEQPGLSYIRSQWLFALAAVLERPVPPDTAAAMRELVRRCSAWRAALASPTDPALPRLNVLLAVAGGYFGQDEQLSAAVAAAGLGDLA